MHVQYNTNFGAIFGSLAIVPTLDRRGICSFQWPQNTIPPPMT